MVKLIKNDLRIDGKLFFKIPSEYRKHVYKMPFVHYSKRLNMYYVYEDITFEQLQILINLPSPVNQIKVPYYIPIEDTKLLQEYEHYGFMTPENFDLKLSRLPKAQQFFAKNLFEKNAGHLRASDYTYVTDDIYDRLQFFFNLMSDIEPKHYYDKNQIFELVRELRSSDPKKSKKAKQKKEINDELVIEI